MKTLLMTALLCLAFNASAACPAQRPGELPVLPDGAAAGEEEMYQAGLAAETFLSQAQIYMDCGVMNRRQHLALAARMETLSQAYNEEMAEFQLRANTIAEK